MADWRATDSKWSAIMTAAIVVAALVGMAATDIVGRITKSRAAEACIASGMEWIDGNCRQPQGSTDD